MPTFDERRTIYGAQLVPDLTKGLSRVYDFYTVGPDVAVPRVVKLASLTDPRVAEAVLWVDRAEMTPVRGSNRMMVRIWTLPLPDEMTDEEAAAYVRPVDVSTRPPAEPGVARSVKEIVAGRSVQIAREMAVGIVAATRRNEPKPDTKRGGMRASHNEDQLVSLFVGGLAQAVEAGRRDERGRIVGLWRGLTDAWRRVFRDPENGIDEKSKLLADVRADALEIGIAVVMAQALPPELAREIGPMEAQEALRRARGDAVSLTPRARAWLRGVLVRSVGMANHPIAGEILAALDEAAPPVPERLTEEELAVVAGDPEANRRRVIDEMNAEMEPLLGSPKVDEAVIWPEKEKKT